MRVHLLAPCIGILICSCAHDPREVAAAQWHLARTARFEVLTDGDPERARALVEDLERFHIVMMAKTTASERETAPLRVFLMRDGSAYRALGGLRRTAGIFATTPRGPVALIDLPRDEEGETEMTGRNILFHEYVHHVIALAGGRVPSWYNEGTAEYMATTEFRDDGSYTVGKPPLYRTQQLEFASWVPLDTLMESENILQLSQRYARRHQYVDGYAQAWYLMHYLSADGTRTEQLGDYLALYRQGVPNARAVEQAFGVSVRELDARLKKYARQHRLDYVSVTPQVPLQGAAVQTGALSAAQAHYRLGDLLLSTAGPTRSTLQLLEEARRLAPRAGRVHAMLARYYLRWARFGDSVPEAFAEEHPGGDPFATAREQLRLARELAPDDPEVLVMLGHLRSFEAARAQTSAPENARDALREARNAYRLAIKNNEAMAEAYHGLGRTYLIDDNGSKEAIVVLEVAQYLTPLEPDIAFTLARIYAGRGQYDEALEPVQYIASMAHSVSWGERAMKELQALRENIEQGASASKNTTEGGARDDARQPR